jgi:hypothetical protein
VGEEISGIDGPILFSNVLCPLLDWLSMSPFFSERFQLSLPSREEECGRASSEEIKGEEKGCSSFSMFEHLLFSESEMRLYSKHLDDSEGGGDSIFSP